MVAFTGPLRALSAIWKGVKRGAKRTFDLSVESQMRRAQLEIDRYHRKRSSIWSMDDHLFLH